MKRKRSANKYDLVVEKLTQEFSKIANFDLTRDDGNSNKVFGIIAFRIADISSYKELVIQYIIPAANKAIFIEKKAVNESKYKNLIKAQHPDFDETIYDTIRNSYIGLFHKFENYINDVILLPELIFEDLINNIETVHKWAKEKFDFDIKDWQQFAIIHKINWICNCVKHKDGFPLKEPKPQRFQNLDENQRIRIRPDEFKSDCESLLSFYPIYLRTFILIAQHKMAVETVGVREDWIQSPGFFEQQLQNLQKVDDSVRQYVTLLKQCIRTTNYILI